MKLLTWDLTICSARHEIEPKRRVSLVTSSMTSASASAQSSNVLPGLNSSEVGGAVSGGDLLGPAGAGVSDVLSFISVSDAYRRVVKATNIIQLIHGVIGVPSIDGLGEAPMGRGDGK